MDDFDDLFKWRDGVTFIEKVDGVSRSERLEEYLSSYILIVNNSDNEQCFTSFSSYT